MSISAPETITETAPESATLVGRSAVTAGQSPPAAYEPMRISPRTHLVILIGSLIVVALAMSMSIQGQEKVALPGMGSSLPELCHMKRVFRVPCPGCGLTRSFISMGHFDLFAAASYNVVGIPLFMLTLVQIPYRAYWLLKRDPRRMPFSALRLEGGLMILFSVLLVVQWVIRMVAERL